MTVRGVIFDMGGTLLNYHPPDADPKHGWREMEGTGADAMRAFLLEQGYDVPLQEEARDYNFTVMERHWRRIGAGNREANPRLGPMLREVMIAWGLPEDVVQDGLLDQALAAYVAPVQAYVAPLEGARDTLAALQSMGLRLGLFSNTVWPGTFHRDDLIRWGLMPYLECAFFSADVAAWKPFPESFRLALKALDLRPEEAIYVGDHPYFDVYGAQQAGMKGVWIKSAEWDDPRKLGLDITPDATLTRLSDLLDAVRQWV